jgi:hypothetical protein
MSMSVLLQPAPGWYPDPAGLATYRWWDGDVWTEGTHAGTQDGTPGLIPEQLFADVAPIAPDLAPAAAPAPALAPILSEPLLPPLAIAEPLVTEPAFRPAPAEQPARRATAPAKTRWSSLLVAFPFIYPLAVGMVVGLAYAGGLSANVMALGIIGAVVAIAALIPAWVFADNDRRELVARGYEPAPSIAWMLLLPPVAYLLARRRVVGPRF